MSTQQPQPHRPLTPPDFSLPGSAISRPEQPHPAPRAEVTPKPVETQVRTPGAAVPQSETIMPAAHQAHEGRAHQAPRATIQEAVALPTETPKIDIPMVQSIDRPSYLHHQADLAGRKPIEEAAVQIETAMSDDVGRQAS